MVVLKIVSLILWLLAVPFGMGLLPMPLLEKRFRTPGAVLAAGYILLFTALELVGIPVVLLAIYNGFTIFKNVFAPVTVLCAAAGIFVTWREKKNGYELNFQSISACKDKSMEEKIMLILFVVIAGVQLYMSFARASFDGDDAYYGAQAVIAQQIDTLYRVNPYTGRSAPLDVRHCLALFPIWEAYIGSMSGIHATIICHSVAPLLLIPLTYILYNLLGRQLLKEKKELLPMFMVLIALWQMFGNISIYTTETFFLTRTWQGKSFAGNFVIPAVIWIFLCLMEEKNTGRIGFWILLTCLNFAGGASSSLAILLSCLMTAGFSLLFAIKEKRMGIFIKGG
ncbi:MAG: hypothetical protein K2N55_08440, partial [Lachnospiraceae bacterium]|nr:hypothetical protein [Lachnospiraceae bacterium]